MSRNNIYAEKERALAVILAFLFSVGCIEQEPITYTIGGDISGLGEFQSVTLVLNGGVQELSHFGSDGPTFEFNNAVEEQTPYQVTVKDLPSFFTCEVTGGGNGTGGGTVTGNVNNIVVFCEELTIAQALENVTPSGGLEACIIANTGGLTLVSQVFNLNCGCCVDLTDAVGLGQFANLTHFNAFNTTDPVVIEDLEMAPLVNLTNLTMNLTKLDSINLSTSIALTDLDLGLNLLTEIDLTTNVNLKNVDLTLNCWDPVTMLNTVDGYLDTYTPPAPGGTYNVSAGGIGC